ncbi:MAG: flagellar motor protein MotB [Treponema sp. CETP13]|nr:MAG: flagellar motor protein MotB [Treponema sp. CETP13]
MAKKQKKTLAGPSKAWLETYGDMITLMLCFFVMLFNPTEVDKVQVAAISVALNGDPNVGGISLADGTMSDLGNNINSLPSMEKGSNLGPAFKKAISLFSPDLKSNKVSITSDQRGLVITLASDSFFRTGSAELDIEETRETLLRLSQFLSSSDLGNRQFRIEGHTDSTPVDPDMWPSNWELSSMRAINVLHYLSDFGADEARFSIVGYSNTMPKYSNDTAEGRAYNRRVDIIILDEGHF